jgi:uncharacterized protein YbjT (DUF2867 family)
VPLRLVVRDPARAPALDGADVAVATYDDADAMRHAFSGAKALLFVSAEENADRLTQHRRVVDAAVDAGVEHIVYLSFLNASATSTFTLARDHFHTERHIVEFGLANTFLRDSLYIDMLPHFVGPDDVIRAPAGDGRFAPVARTDVADVAAAVLLDRSAHVGRTYDLTGPELITLAEAADELARATGRPITYHPETIEEAFASRSQYGAPDWEVAGWVSSYVAIAAGELEVVTDCVDTLAGHAPMSVREWLQANSST